MSDVPVVPVDPADADAMRRWQVATARGFHETVTRDVEDFTRRVAGRRLWAGLDGDEVVATFGDFDADLPVPGGPGAGGGDLPTAPALLVTAVTVAPTHRRRGLLSSWMRSALERGRESGACVASLIASEAPIYGRFGFGPAVDAATWRVDVRRAAVAPDRGECPAHGRHTLRLVEDADLEALGPGVYEAARRRQPAAPPRPATDWEDLARPTERPGSARLTLAHSPESATTDAYVRVRVDDHWEHMDALSTAVVEDWAAVDPRTASCLWRAVLSLDLVATVEAPSVPVGDAVRDLVRDRRAARLAAQVDLYWWRVLDARAALAARGWSVEGSLVLEVVDPDGWAGGRWRLDVDTEGRATVTPTRAAPDLTLPQPALAALLPGHRRAHDLWVAGMVDEHSPAGVARLDAMAAGRATPHVRYQWF